VLDDVAFHDRAVRFLEGQAPRRPEHQRRGWGEGSDHVAVLEEISAETERADLEAVKHWKAIEFDAGYGWLSGPLNYGGAGLPLSCERTFQALKSGFELPDERQLTIGFGMVAPTILAHGSERVRVRYLAALYRADMVACQLFSEPEAGSDLAGVRTRAEQVAGGWLINGQKVWTSGAHFSDIGEILCRTNNEVAKHRGLSAFVVDMHAPGVEVRPLRQMTGGASFNEVFLTDVFVPDDHLLGDVDGGWTVALTTLMNERTSIGANSAEGMGGPSFDDVLRLARWAGRASDPSIRQALADLLVHREVTAWTSRRADERILAGEAPGPAGSISKLAATQNHQRVSSLVAELLGPRLLANTGEWGTYAWSQYVLGVPGLRLAGGTDEIMKNVIAERVLGLPKEPLTGKQQVGT
jgi:alkylation response protein AidB-like acyl-CoA dehydrogenase